MARRWSRPGRSGGNDDPGQLRIDWSAAAVSSPSLTTEPPPVASGPTAVQRLRWDFRKNFPQPTPEAVDAGIIHPDDTDPDNVRSIHEEHANELLAVLNDLDAVSDACRRGVDPRTGHTPATENKRIRLAETLRTELIRLGQRYENLIAVYEDAFGAEAAAAFDKAARAWHAGVEVDDDRRGRTR